MSGQPSNVIPLRPRTLPDPTPERWARIMAEVARDEARREAEIAHICGQFRARLRVVR